MDIIVMIWAMNKTFFFIKTYFSTSKMFS